MNRKDILACLLIVGQILVGLILYRQLPQEIATHWNAQGEVNGFTAKPYALIFTPVLSLGIYVFLRLIVRSDPLIKNNHSMQSQLYTIAAIIVAFLSCLHVLIFIWNLGYSFPIDRAVMISIVPLFFFIGRFMKTSEPNYFAGIRTPWTLSSPDIWKKTHIVAGNLFIIGSIFILLIACILVNPVIPFIGSVVTMTLIPAIYSYILYRSKEK